MEGVVDIPLCIASQKKKRDRRVACPPDELLKVKRCLEFPSFALPHCALAKSHIQAAAEPLVARYIRTGAVEEINIPGTIKARILDGPPDVGMFDEACLMIFDLLQRDYYWPASPSNARMSLRLSHSDLLTDSERLLRPSPSVKLDLRAFSGDGAIGSVGDSLRSPRSRRTYFTPAGGDDSSQGGSAAARPRVLSRLASDSEQSGKSSGVRKRSGSTSDMKKKLNSGECSSLALAPRTVSLPEIEGVYK